MELDVFKGYGVEITLIRDDDFLKVKETLTRIGIASKDKTLYQSCHILHKRGRYAIMHFKELFSIDGKETQISEEDLNRRDSIVTLLKKWGLVEIVDPGFVELSMHNLKILPFGEKKNWKLESKYTVGKKVKHEV
jgi:hypothetical protein